MADDDSRIGGILERISSLIDSASGALDELNEKALKGGIGFEVLIKATENSTKAFNSLLKTVGAVGSALTLGLDFGVISKSMSGLGNLFSEVMGATTGLARILNSVGKGMDSITGFSRALNLSLFESTAKFNGSFEAAKRFSDYIIESAQDFASAEFGFISSADRIAAVKGLEQAGIPLANMSEIIESTAGRMDLLNTSFLQSKALGMEVSSFMELLGNAMLTQGLNAQEATEQMAMFGDISEKTGIRVDKVARSLQSVSNRFAKLGLTANFGQPILEEFTASLTSMGFGFENAIELSETLSSSLVKLTSDYSAAFVTFQRGGLDIGGGTGALGASIGLRAKLADQNTDQGELAMDIAGALKETLSSFTGGQIVNVKQAAENPALQQTFFTQTQLLKDLYGITEAADQDRTLELLQQLGEATESGNTDLAESLGADLMKAVGVQNETLSVAEKTAIATEGTFAELQHLNTNLIEGIRMSGDLLVDLFSGFQKTALNSDVVQGIIKDTNANSPEEIKASFGAGMDSLQNLTTDGYNRLLEEVQNIPGAEDLINALSNTVIQVSNPSGDSLLIEVAGKITGLIDKLDMFINEAKPSQLR